MKEKEGGPGQELIVHLDRLHTTERGVQRVQSNLSLPGGTDVVYWCRERIRAIGSEIHRRGKNWYITSGDCRITVNAYSYTIITAHKR